MRKFSDQSQILRRITNSNSRIIFVKYHIENPMRRVFNSPMPAHRLGSPFSIRRQTGNIISPLSAHLIIKLARRFDHNQTAQTTPLLYYCATCPSPKLDSSAFSTTSLVFLPTKNFE